MKRTLWLMFFLLGSGDCFSQTPKEKIALSIDFSESDKIISILQKLQRNEQVTEPEWAALFNTVPYRKLKEREASYKNEMPDAEFKKFVQSPERVGQASSLSATLHKWHMVNIEKMGKKAFRYLPSQSVIKARVCIVIKPRKNSFVWKQGDSSFLFLYLNPDLSKEQFENKVIHELHHIGINSLETMLDSTIAPLETKQQNAIKWLGSFGEGEAMLAAAGSPDIHPHHWDDTAAIHQWDRDLLNFNRDLDSLQAFFLKILDGKFQNESETEEAAGVFYGTQGPFYTVGYGMASLIEKTFGKQILVDGYVDPRNLLLLYNKAVSTHQKKGQPYKLWSPAFLNKLGSPVPLKK